MTLADPTQIVEVLARLESAPAAKLEPEHRLFTRFPVRAEATLESVEDLSSQRMRIAAMVRNVSRGGVGFVADQPLAMGSIWRVSFERRGREIASQAIAVCFCKQIEEGIYLLGGQFVVEPSLLLMLGVDEAELSNDIRVRDQDHEEGEFTAPDAVS